MDKLKKNRLYIVIIATFALSAIWFLFLYQPNQAKLQLLKQDAARLQQEINESRNLIGKAGNVARRINEADSDLNKCLQGMRTLDSIPGFIVILNDRLDEYGIEGADIVPRLPDLLNNDAIVLGKDKLSKVEFEISGHGRYLNLGKFIESLEEELFYAGCASLDISQNQTLNPDIAFEYKFMAYLKGQG